MTLWTSEVIRYRSMRIATWGIGGPPPLLWQVPPDENSTGLLYTAEFKSLKHWSHWKIRTAEKLLNWHSSSQPADLLHQNHLVISMTLFQMFDFSRGLARGGAQRSPDPIAGFKGAYLSLTKNNVVFLRSACCNNVFSLVQTDGHRCRDSPLPKTSNWME